MLERFGVGFLVLASLAACSASGSQDGAERSDAAPAGDTDSGGGVQPPFDPGPPGTGGDDQPDRGSPPDGGGDAGPPAGTCNSLSDCSSLSSKPGVAGVACTNKACVITCDAT